MKWLTPDNYVLLLSVMRIYLVRHGETPSNASRIVQTPDTPLSDTGAMQARRLAERLAQEKVHFLLSSTLRRAWMTAEVIAETTGATVLRRADLQERNYGDVRGLSYDELAGGILDVDYEPPGGETWREFHKRVDGVWQHLQKVVEDAVDSRDSVGSMVVVTHGLVLHSLVSRHLDTSRLPSVPVAFANTSVTIVEADEPWRVSTLNCTAHLA